MKKINWEFIILVIVVALAIGTLAIIWISDKEVYEDQIQVAKEEIEQLSQDREALRVQVQSQKQELSKKEQAYLDQRESVRRLQVRLDGLLAAVPETVVITDKNCQEEFEGLRKRFNLSIRLNAEQKLALDLCDQSRGEMQEVITGQEKMIETGDRSIGNYKIVVNGLEAKLKKEKKKKRVITVVGVVGVLAVLLLK